VNNLKKKRASSPKHRGGPDYEFSFRLKQVGKNKKKGGESLDKFGLGERAGRLRKRDGNKKNGQSTVPSIREGINARYGCTIRTQSVLRAAARTAKGGFGLREAGQPEADLVFREKISKRFFHHLQRLWPANEGREQKNFGQKGEGGLFDGRVDDVSVEKEGIPAHLKEKKKKTRRGKREMTLKANYGGGKNGRKNQKYHRQSYVHTKQWAAEYPTRRVSPTTDRMKNSAERGPKTR